MNYNTLHCEMGSTSHKKRRPNISDGASENPEKQVLFEKALQRGSHFFEKLGLTEWLGALVLLVATMTNHASFQVRNQQFYAERVQGTSHSRNLIEDVEAVAILVNHLSHTVDLAVDAIHTRFDFFRDDSFMLQSLNTLIKYLSR